MLKEDPKFDLSTLELIPDITAENPLAAHMHEDFVSVKDEEEKGQEEVVEEEGSE